MDAEPTIKLSEFVEGVRDIYVEWLHMQPDLTLASLPDFEAALERFGAVAEDIDAEDIEQAIIKDWVRNAEATLANREKLASRHPGEYDDDQAEHWGGPFNALPEGITYTDVKEGLIPWLKRKHGLE